MRGELPPVRVCQGSNGPGLPDRVWVVLNPTMVFTFLLRACNMHTPALIGSTKHKYRLNEQ